MYLRISQIENKVLLKGEGSSGSGFSRIYEHRDISNAGGIATGVFGLVYILRFYDDDRFLGWDAKNLEILGKFWDFDFFGDFQGADK